MDRIINGALDSHNHRNEVFFGLSEEYFLNIKEKIKNGNPEYLDFVIDFSDLDKLKDFFIFIDDNQRLADIKRKIYDDYMAIKILEQIKEKGFELTGKCKFIDLEENFRAITGFYTGIDNIDLVETVEVNAQLKSLAKATAKSPRIHLFLDSVEDPILQEVINKNFYIAGRPIIMAYSSKKDLITRKVNEEVSLEDGADLMAFYKENSLRKASY